MYPLILSLWREILIATLAISLSFVYLYKDNQLKTMAVDLAQYKSGLEFQNATLLANSKEYKRKLAELPKEIETIKTKYRVIYKNIETWKGDENVSELQNVDNFLDSVQY